ncbi:MAG: TRAP transporter small permease subunit [Marinilabiliales bacterium]|nr:TRAP transporter small permease subunit [Marinilabiliales bacterium]
MKLLKNISRGIVDVIEIYLPIGVFVVMFGVFLINIFTRYVLRNLQNWTFEFSVNLFVIVGVLGAQDAYRLEDHVVFDLAYARRSPRKVAIMRMISYVLVIVFLAVAAFLDHRACAESCRDVDHEDTDRYIHSVIPIMMVSVLARSVCRLVLDIWAFARKTYAQTYNTEEKARMP